MMSSMKIALVLFIFALTSFHVSCTDEGKDLLVFTVATETTDAFKRYMRSAKVYGINVQVLGMGLNWDGGDMTKGAGGGQKINLLRKELKKYKDQKNLIIMFTDSYDVLFTGPPSEILTKFGRTKARVLFSAEDVVWPDKSLTEHYPKVVYGYRYLNSGSYIGYANDIYSIVAPNAPVPNNSDDQLYFTKVFLDKKMREKHVIKLDSLCRLFQTLNDFAGDVSLKFGEDDTRLVNTVFNSNPVVIHGNGPSKTLLLSLGNYLAKSWTVEKGCLICLEDRKELTKVEKAELPAVLVGLFVETGTPFLEEMLQKLKELDYPKERMHFYIHNQIPKHSSLLTNFSRELSESGVLSVTHITHEDNLKEWHARNRAVSECIAKDCGYYFSLDSEVHLDNPQTLKLLIQHNRPILGAIMVQTGKAWSTFWGATTHDGYYARSTDYMDIVNGQRRGIWAVPYINGIYLIQRSVLDDPKTRPDYINLISDPDIAMTKNYRMKNIMMYATNLEEYGHLIDSSAFPIEKLHPDLWQMVLNREEWEQRYLHPQYLDGLDPTKLNDMPCPDVYWFPLFSDRFCNELIETMEDFGDWSGGKNTDERVSGGYENVPTVDIHMTQVEFQQEGLWILKEYVKPLAEKVYLGYSSNAYADLIFVVRYKPTEQSFLRPHHDSSTYTINVGLNRPGIDYEGGGARFIRYNCSVVNTRMGWALMHPGRLTHYHEGLQTTKGTRYILVSFIDP